MTDKGMTGEEILTYLAENYNDLSYEWKMVITYLLTRIEEAGGMDFEEMVH